METRTDAERADDATNELMDLIDTWRHRHDLSFDEAMSVLHAASGEVLSAAEYFRD